MNSESWKLAENIVPTTYIHQAVDAARSRENTIRQLIQHRKIPINGWDDYTIELFLHQLSGMDSNNFPSNCGVGEREGRIASALVAKRHFNFSHGVGRSGDLNEVQPKAAGSSLMAKLTNAMLKDLFSFTGIQDAVHCLFVPVATSMSLVLSMITLRTRRPDSQFVIWSRIDQKACFKSILTAGFTPVVVDTVLSNEQLLTNVEEIENKIKVLGAERILCVITTTSCFAPRACDSVEHVAKICEEYSVPHVINNAYGLQSLICMKRIQKAYRKGRVDIFVQSSDKNLMVPVGGSIIAGFDKGIIEKISSIYPGRASSSPLVDVFITLLSLGKTGYESLIKHREDMYIYLRKKLIILADKYDEHVLETPHNPISIGVSLSTLKPDQLTKAGSMLFIKNVSGARIITTYDKKDICGYRVEGWGSHCSNYPTPYLTCAASIGITESDIDLFVKRLDKVLSKIKRIGDEDN